MKTLYKLVNMGHENLSKWERKKSSSLRTILLNQKFMKTKHSEYLEIVILEITLAAQKGLLENQPAGFWEG